MDDHDGFLEVTGGAMDMVYNLARRTMRNPEDAKDLLQDTYLAAFRAWKSRRRPRKVEPWMATICLNLARTRLKQRSRRPLQVELAEADWVQDPRADTSRDALEAIDREELNRALWQINPDQRAAIALVDLGGLTTGEAAKVMDTPVGTVLSRLHRGRAALATILSPSILEVEP